MKRVGYLCAYTLLLIVIPAVVFGATITLKSGTVVEGTIIEVTDEYTKIDFYGTPLTFYKADIVSIDKGPSAQAANAHPDEILINDPKTFEDFIKLAERYAHFGDLVKAASYAEQANGLQKDTADYHRVSFMIYFLQKEYEDATGHLIKQLQIEKSRLPDLFSRPSKELEGFDARERWRSVLLSTYPTLVSIYIASGFPEAAESTLKEYEAFVSETQKKVQAQPAGNSLVGTEELASASEALQMLRAMMAQITTPDGRQQILGQIKNGIAFAGVSWAVVNERTAQQWVELIAHVINEHKEKTGKYPATLFELYKSEEAASRPLPAEFGIAAPRNPKYSEYEYTYTPQGNDAFVLVATPVVLGKSGTKCFSSKGSGSVEIDQGCDGIADPPAPLNETRYDEKGSDLSS